MPRMGKWGARTFGVGEPAAERRPNKRRRSTMTSYEEVCCLLRETHLHEEPESPTVKCKLSILLVRPPDDAAKAAIAEFVAEIERSMSRWRQAVPFSWYSRTELYRTIVRYRNSREHTTGYEQPRIVAWSASKHVIAETIFADAKRMLKKPFYKRIVLYCKLRFNIASTSEMYWQFKEAYEFLGKPGPIQKADDHLREFLRIQPTARNIDQKHAYFFEHQFEMLRTMEIRSLLLDEWSTPIFVTDLGRSSGLGIRCRRNGDSECGAAGSASAASSLSSGYCMAMKPGANSGVTSDPIADTVVRGNKTSPRCRARQRSTAILPVLNSGNIGLSNSRKETRPRVVPVPSVSTFVGVGVFNNPRSLRGNALPPLKGFAKELSMWATVRLIDENYTSKKCFACHSDLAATAFARRPPTEPEEKPPTLAEEPPLATAHVHPVPAHRRATPTRDVLHSTNC
ncbi:hypothetical protein ON010_g15109 [Phytophthora cinnamomi]|nr:hypothetical protein ON010_g15109 [Phytophthora cinnamomi]